MKLSGSFNLFGLSYLFLPKEEKEFYIRIKNSFDFSPRDLKLYHLAFTHKSAFESKKYWKPRKDRPKKPFTIFLQNSRARVANAGNTNERLEFLGDAVLSLLIGNILYEKYPQADEGFLSDMRARVVNRDFFNDLGKRIGVEDFIRREFPTERGNDFEIVDSILGNAFEAVFGAIFLDQGFLATQKVLNKIILTHQINLEEIRSNNKNYKSQILEWGQKQQVPIEFKLSDTIKQGNDIVFIIELWIDGLLKGTGTAKKKKKAEQEAAFQGLTSLGLIK